jgi:phosphatidate cytidylyltransferase
VADSEKPRSDLGPRLITAAIGVPAILAIALAAPVWAVWLLWGIAAAIGAQEWVSMCTGRAAPGLVTVTAAWTLALVSVVFWLPTPLAVYAVAAAGLIGVMLVAVWGAEPEQAARRITGALSAATYASILFGSLVILVSWGTPPAERAPDQAAWMLLPLFVIWSGDTGAYFVGRAFGRHKLAPRISPKKTWEGALGGAAASIGGGFVAALLFETAPPAWVIAAIAAPAAVLGQVGDLAESALKRAVGIKDSGRILYGHGGVLDRVDALVFAAPWFVLARAAFLG